jgi:hypothetical protein
MERLKAPVLEMDYPLTGRGLLSHYFDSVNNRRTIR